METNTTQEKRQIVVIHGGDTYESYEAYLEALEALQLDFTRLTNSKRDWKQNLAADLGDAYDIVLPPMPNKQNATYLEWSIWFEKILPFLDEHFMLIGHSLGATFLVKYLAEHVITKSIDGLLLVAPAFDAEGTDYSMGDFVMPSDLSGVSAQCDVILLYHSADDRVVDASQPAKFKHAIPALKIREFKDRGHFNQEHVPELCEDIKNNMK